MIHLVDESFDHPIITRPRKDGHKVRSIAQESPGVSDTEVLAKAKHAGIVLITVGTDFGKLVHRLQLPHSGLLFV